MRTLVTWIFRLIVGGMLVVSGGIHWSHPAKFASSVAAYQLIPESAIGWIAWLLPPTQIVVGLGILFDRQRKVPLLGGLILYASFAMIQVIAIALGREISCGCFGWSEEPIGWKTLMPAALGLIGCNVALKRYLESRPTTDGNDPGSDSGKVG